jgi:PAS domain S-box-containing protein
MELSPWSDDKEGMQTPGIEPSRDTSPVALLSLVRAVAADAAAQADPDSCLRHLRGGLIRLGFSRSGVLVTDPQNPQVFRGTWGTDWDGAEADEHQVVDVPPPGSLSWQILQGEHVACDRIARPVEPNAPSYAWVAGLGLPNHACVALRADGQLFGMIAVDMLPTDRTISANQIAALELLADLVAVAVARGRAAATLRAELVERQRAEAALRESEERFRFLVEHTRDALYRLRFDTLRYDYMSPSIEALTGYTPAEINELGFDHLVKKVVTPAGEGMPPNLIARQLEAGDVGSYTADYLIQTKSGALHWLADDSQSWRDASGKLLGSVGILSDINQRKKNDAELARQYREAAQARGEARAILDATDESMVMVGPAGEIRSMNRRLGELFGTSLDELAGRNIADLQSVISRVFADPASIAERLRETSAATDQGYTVNVTQRWPQERELELFSAPVHDSIGEFLGRLYAFRDVTHEREVDRMKTEFVALVSHELRTPLTSIKGFADLLLDEPDELGREQREFVDIIKANADRLVALINDLLDISRIESGKIELRLTAVDLGRVLQSVARSLQPQLEQKEQRLTVEVAFDVAAVWADADRLTQIFTNLLSNAHKYTPRGGSIALRARHQADQVLIEVTDTGIGMSPEEQAQLYTRFFRAPNRTTQEVAGTGLGLTITRSLVQMHRGKLSVRSAPGEGSTFTVTLPVASSLAEPPAFEPPAPLPPRGERVLVVDDEPDIASLLRRYLERGGYQVSVAHSANEALVLARSEPFDLITLDIALKDTDGFTALEWLKTDPLTQRIPVMMISVFDDDAGRGKRLGAVEYLHKPVDEPTLLGQVGLILGSAQTRLVLVADDDPNIRALISQYLRRASYRVIEASNGSEAVRLAHEHRPDLALIDVKMPGTDGIGALRALRSDPATCDLPVLMMTISPGVLERNRPIVEGLASDLVAKSMSAEEWVELVRRWLARRA